jgi:hypothetical protein
VLLTSSDALRPWSILARWSRFYPADTAFRLSIIDLSEQRDRGLGIYGVVAADGRVPRFIVSKSQRKAYNWDQYNGVRRSVAWVRVRIRLDLNPLPRGEAR